MEFHVEQNKILIPDNTYFSAEKTLTCGQIFRYRKAENAADCESVWEVLSADQRARIYERGRESVIECSDPDYFINYFDLTEEYAGIESEVLRRAGSGREADFMRRAVGFGRGIRILRQDFFETVIGFIISANNNIKRIQGIVERLCAAAGKDTGGFFAFPAVGTLAISDEKFYNSIGAGYRSRYIGRAAALLQAANPADPRALNPDGLRRMNPSDAARLLLELPGVGPKVADCILLFACRNTAAFPVDTWIAQCYGAYFEDGATDRKYIRARLAERFGGVSGFAQQYMFHYHRTFNN
ncbi:8-oxoguanine DNA glycosylase [Clostridia bacterium]|nr:8-oxoguanine DNA glycosylase [Clostridia bacterium]